MTPSLEEVGYPRASSIRLIFRTCVCGCLLRSVHVCAPDIPRSAEDRRDGLAVTAATVLAFTPYPRLQRVVHDSVGPHKAVVLEVQCLPVQHN